MSKRALQRLRESTDLQEFTAREKDTAFGAGMILAFSLLLLACLAIILPSLITPLLSLGNLVLVVLTGVAAIILAPFAMMLASWASEALVERRVPQLEEQLAELEGWRPRIGSRFAPHGSQDHYILQREPTRGGHRLRVSLQHWSMGAQGWNYQADQQVQMEFTHHQEEEMRAYEAELREMAQRLNQHALEDGIRRELEEEQAATQRRELEAQARRERELESEDARAFVKINQGSELLL